ncbi:hypothetical protein D3C87_1478710 [compost metagenome]
MHPWACSMTVLASLSTQNARSFSGAMKHLYSLPSSLPIKPSALAPYRPSSVMTKPARFTKRPVWISCSIRALGSSSWPRRIEWVSNPSSSGSPLMRSTAKRKA